jgi:hypothetical protein
MTTPLTKLRRLVVPAYGKSVSNLSPEARRWFRRFRSVFPPHFPNHPVGLWAIVRYCHDAQLKGDIVECGVGRGVSFFQIASFADSLGLQKKIVGFDSFQVFPEPSLNDDSARKPKAGEWNDTSLDHVKGHFTERNMGRVFDERCTLVPGFFENTLRAALPFTSIAFLHLDVDLYESYLTCGMRLGPMVESEGIIVYDEYAEDKWPGATKAVNEILERLGHTLFYSPFMNKYFSLNSDAGSGEALSSLLAVLQAQPVQAQPVNAT